MSNSHTKQPRSKKTKKATKLYEVILFYSQDSRCRKVVEATSLVEAEEKADEISAEDLFDHELDPVNGDIYIDSVKPLEGGENNE